MIFFDTGTQTNSLPSERILSLFNKHINNNNKIIIEFTNTIQLILNNEDIIRKKGLLKSTSVFQSNSLGKIVLGINFIRTHNMIFNFYDRYILIEGKYNKLKKMKVQYTKYPTIYLYNF